MAKQSKTYTITPAALAAGIQAAESADKDARLKASATAANKRHGETWSGRATAKGRKAILLAVMAVDGTPKSMEAYASMVGVVAMKVPGFFLRPEEGLAGFRAARALEAQGQAHGLKELSNLPSWAEVQKAGAKGEKKGAKVKA